MSDLPYRIRPATADDIPVITHHRRAMFEAMGRGAPAELDAMERTFPPWLAPRLERGEWRHWLAVAPDGATAAGGGIWVMDWAPSPVNLAQKMGNILNVYTEPAHRRRGLARLVMRSILAWCAGNGVRHTLLHASDEGRPLYEQLGFAPSNEMRLTLDTAPSSPASCPCP